MIFEEYTGRCSLYIYYFIGIISLIFLYNLTALIAASTALTTAALAASTVASTIKNVSLSLYGCRNSFD
jgi:inner membrane protein involved in colicin E2 resistance